MDGGNTAQEVVTKTIPKKKKCKNAKWLTEEAFQIAEKRREAKGKEEEKERCVCVYSSHSVVSDSANPWTVAHQASLS